jgi:Zn-dependent metalloprotease
MVSEAPHYHAVKESEINMARGFSIAVLVLAGICAADVSEAGNVDAHHREMIKSYAANNYGIGSLNFESTGSSVSSNGTVHTKYQLMLNGIPVENKYVQIHTFSNGNTLLSDNFFDEDGFMETFNAYNITDAKHSANELIYIKTDRSDELTLARHETVIVSGSGDMASVYRDPDTGEILKTTSHRCDLDSVGIAHTHYMGVHPITTSYTNNGHFILENSQGPVSVQDLVNNTNPTSAVPLTDHDNNWDNSLFATDAFIATNAYLEMLTVNLSRNSIDNNGMPLRCLVNYGNNVNNAFWNGTQVIFGSPSPGNNTMTTYDITGHEFTHGLIQHSAGLIYSYESGAINEAIADIFGVALEYYATGSLNWEIGEETGNTLRSVSDPVLYNQPAYYRGFNWYFGSGDNGGVHINSGVINRWFYLVSEGGQGVDETGRAYEIDGIGFDPALHILYEVLNYYLFPDDNMTKFRERMLNYAAFNFGYCSKEFTSVKEAFKAVGIEQTVIASPYYARSSGMSQSTPVSDLNAGLSAFDIPHNEQVDIHGNQNNDILAKRCCRSKIKSFTESTEQLAIVEQTRNHTIVQLSSETNTNNRSIYKLLSSTGQIINTGRTNSYQIIINHDDINSGLYFLMVNNGIDWLRKRILIR